MNKKRAVICCAIGLGLLIFGGLNFELYGIDSNFKAIVVALSITLGLVLPIYGFYGLGRSNDKTTANEKDKELYEHQKFDDERLEKLYNKGEKPMAKTKETSTSVTLMKREKELETRRKELESLLAEVTKEEQSVEKELIDKGWVQKDGSWVIE